MSTIIDRELVERCARAAYVAERPALGGERDMCRHRQENR